MTQNKITVTWDDLRSRKVETRLKEQDALARNRDYARLDESALPEGFASEPSRFAKIWHNGVFVMGVFGLIGGMLAWVCGASLQLRVNVKADAERRMQEIHHVSGTAERPGSSISRKDADAIVDRLLAAGRQENAYLKVLTDPSLTDAAKERLLPEIEHQDKMKVLIRNVLALGAGGVMIALFLAIAMPMTERNLSAVVINGSVGAALGLIGGIVVSLLADKIHHLVVVNLDGQAEATRQTLARVAVWGAMGLFLTAGPGIVMRNWKKLGIGLFGGFMGGVIGGALYDPVVTAVAQSNSRIADQAESMAELVAMVAIGLVAGVSTGLIENVAKAGWLRVTQGLIAGKQFILYRNPTFVGSGPDCQIYLFKDPKVGRRHAAIHIVPGGYELEDLPLGESTFINGRPVNRSRLKNGDRIQIGATCLVFQEKAPAA